MFWYPILQDFKILTNYRSRYIVVDLQLIRMICSSLKKRSLGAIQGTEVDSWLTLLGVSTEDLLWIRRSKCLRILDTPFHQTLPTRCRKQHPIVLTEVGSCQDPTVP